MHVEKEKELSQHDISKPDSRQVEYHVYFISLCNIYVYFIYIVNIELSP